VAEGLLVRTPPAGSQVAVGAVRAMEGETRG
jgi:hypothetical protein